MRGYILPYSSHPDISESKWQRQRPASRTSTSRTSRRKKLDVKETEKEPDFEYPALSKVVVIILGLYLAVFLVALDQTIIGVAIPKITDQFKSIEDIAWYGSAYFLTSTALQPSYGRIYKIFSVGFLPCCMC